MKIRIDENISPHLAKYIRVQVLRDGWELTHVREIGHGGKDDDHWITLFAKEGGNAIITGDDDFIKKPEAVNAVFDTGMRVIHLPKRFCNSQIDMQSAHLLLWWRRIEQKIETMSQRECYSPPWNLAQKGELRKTNIDFAKAQKKRRKQRGRKSKKAA